MQRNPHIRRGLERAGFTGGWLGAPPEPGAVPPSSPSDSGNGRTGAVSGNEDRAP